MSAEVLLGLESDVIFRQHGRSFGRNFSSEIKQMFEKCMQYAYGLIFFLSSLLNIIQDQFFLYFVLSLILHYNVI